MTFAELPLYAALNDAYAVFENHRSDTWLYIEANKKKLYEFIRNRFPQDYHVLAEDIFHHWSLFGRRKLGEPGDDNRLTYAQLAVQIYLRDGARCFYAGRGLGECSEEASIDRIIPGSRGGNYVVENCLLACDNHNSRRGDLPIEHFLTQSSVKVMKPL